MKINVTPRLVKLLKERGISQTEFAQTTGLPQGYISRFDKNDRYAITNLLIVARTLDVAVEELFEIEIVEE